MQKWKTALWTAVALGMVGALMRAAAVYGGLYNIAATAQHKGLIYALLDKSMHSSVRLRARHVVVAASLADPGPGAAWRRAPPCR